MHEPGLRLIRDANANARRNVRFLNPSPTSTRRKTTLCRAETTFVDSRRLSLEHASPYDRGESRLIGGKAASASGGEGCGSHRGRNVRGDGRSIGIESTYMWGLLATRAVSVRPRTTRDASTAGQRPSHERSPAAHGHHSRQSRPSTLLPRCASVRITSRQDLLTSTLASFTKSTRTRTHSHFQPTHSHPLARMVLP
jgi:hypothetical protein